MNKKITKFSPLTEVMYYILIALLNPLHGYGVIKKVEKMSNGRVIIAAGTLYGALNTLLNNKLIVLIDADEGSRRKKLYQTTSLGKKLLKYEIVRLDSMSKTGAAEMEGIQ